MATASLILAAGESPIYLFTMGALSVPFLVIGLVSVWKKARERSHDVRGFAVIQKSKLDQ